MLINTEKVRLYFSETLKLFSYRIGQQEQFKSALADFLGINSDNIFLFASARGALSFLLRSIAKTGGKILIPAGDAVDLSNGFEWGKGAVQRISSKEGRAAIKCDKDDVAVVTYPLGLPLNGLLLTEARDKCFTVEYAPDAFGMEIEHRKVGTLGDFSVFSLAYDKSFSSLLGGVLICNNAEYMLQIKREYTKLRQLPDMQFVLRYSVFILKSILSGYLFRRMKHWLRIFLFYFTGGLGARIFEAPRKTTLKEIYKYPHYLSNLALEQLSLFPNRRDELFENANVVYNNLKYKFDIVWPDSAGGKMTNAAITKIVFRDLTFKERFRLITKGIYLRHLLKEENGKQPHLYLLENKVEYKSEDLAYIISCFEKLRPRNAEE